MTYQRKVSRVVVAAVKIIEQDETKVPNFPRSGESIRGTLGIDDIFEGF